MAAAQTIGVTPAGHVDLVLSAGRGQRAQLPHDVLLIDDCYNANPMSMRAALDDLAATAAVRTTRARQAAASRCSATCSSSAPTSVASTRRSATYANDAQVDLLITVGPIANAMTHTFTHGEAHATGNAPEAAALAQTLLQPGDTILVKASRGVGLELVCGALQTAEALA